MLTRKINAGISLLSTFLILAHAISIAVWLLSMGAISRIPAIVPRILTVLVLIHAVISVALLVSGNVRGEPRKSKKYPKLNRTMIVQRISGVLTVLFTALHVVGAMGALQLPGIAHAIISPLFFAIALIHVAVSTSKALITLGIGNGKVIKIVDILIKVVCAATWIADVAGAFLFTW